MRLLTPPLPGVMGMLMRNAQHGRPNPVLSIVSRTAAVYETEATSVAVTLPARVVGDRVILCLNRSSLEGDAIATPTGWTAITTGFTGTGNSFCRVYYQDVTAANVGDTTASFTGGTSSTSVSYIWLVRGALLAVAPVGAGTRANSVGSTTVDPDGITPYAGLVRNTAWLAYLGTNQQDTSLGATPAVTVFPSTYGNTGTNTTTHVTPASGCGQGYGDKISVAASDDPSAWTFMPTSVSGRGLAISVAVAGY